MHVEERAAQDEASGEGHDFMRHRPLLIGIAYRMLGSMMDAEDVVQEAYLRFQSATARDTVRDARAFLCTVVTRLSLNTLQSARKRREKYVGPWLPEPLLPGEAAALIEAEKLDQADSISMAFLVLLQRLTPAERAVFLLREVFDYEYAEIAGILIKREPACRQLFSRAKSRIRDSAPRYTCSPREHRRIVTSFVQAASSGEMNELLKILAQDVSFHADGGGKAPGAVTQPLHGREIVAKFLLTRRRFVSEEATQLELTEINGEAAAILWEYGTPLIVMTFEVSDGLIRRMRFIANPDKLLRFQQNKQTDLPLRSDGK